MSGVGRRWMLGWYKLGLGMVYRFGRFGDGINASVGLAQGRFGVGMRSVWGWHTAAWPCAPAAHRKMGP